MAEYGLELVNEQFLRAGLVLYVDSDGALTYFQDKRSGVFGIKALEKLLGDRVSGMRRYLIRQACGAKGET